MVSRSIAAAFLIAAFSPALSTGRTVNDATTERLRAVIVQGSWTEHVTSGRIAIEDVTLAFCTTGDVVERIVDDTGVHKSTGTWDVRSQEGTLYLDLTGSGLRMRGSFGIRYDERDEAIELWSGDPSRASRYVRDRRPITSDCPAPK